jgi:hypothetical protein
MPQKKKRKQLALQRIPIIAIDGAGQDWYWCCWRVRRRVDWTMGLATMTYVVLRVLPFHTSS